MLPATGTFISRPSSRRFSVRKAMRAAMARRGVMPATGLPPMTSSPLSKGSRPKRMRASSVRPEPIRPKRPTTSPADTRRSISRTTPRAVRARASKQHLVAAGAGARRVELVDVAPQHQVDHAGDGELRRGAGRDQPAVAQDRDVVGQRLHVAEDVRDVDDGLAARGQPGDELEQPGGLAGGERGGRLVEDDDAGHRAAAPWRPRPAAARPAKAARPGCRVAGRG